MKKSIGDIFLKPEKLYMALYHTDSEYTEDNSLDFYDQIYPRLLRHVLDQKLYEKNYTFLYTGYPAPKTTEESFVVGKMLLEHGLNPDSYYGFYPRRTTFRKFFERNCAKALGIAKRKPECSHLAQEVADFKKHFEKVMPCCKVFKAKN